MNLRERFDAQYIPVTESGCWLWTGAVNQKGYGEIGVEGRLTRAHRTSWSMSHGPIPNGIWVLHKCDVRCCVNPAHLFLGTARQNTEDSIKKGRWASGSKSGNSKLTMEQIVEIRKLRNQGMTQRALAKLFDVSQYTIWGIVNGLRYKPCA